MSKENENLNGIENSALNIADVMPRFFLDERVGCIAIRDSHHPDFDVEHQGLDSELPDVVEFEMGKLVNNDQHNVTWLCFLAFVVRSYSTIL